MRPRLLGRLLLAVAAAPALPAGGASTQGVFDRFAPGVVQIRVVDVASGAKSTIGSGFYVSAAGDIVTNYHVVADLVHEPDRHRAERVGRDGEAAPLTLRGFDVIHDLAIVRHDGDRPERVLRLRAGGAPRQGTRLYALGHPHDLGLSVVEGTYNGLLEHHLYDRVHFTGSINPGMSGGPAISAAGEVIGVNVSTAGNQVSFLVPVARVAELLATEAADGDEARPHLEIVREQLLRHQDAYFATLLADEPLPTRTVAPFVLPDQIAPFVHCWGDHDDDEKRRYSVVTRECSTEDYVFIGDDQWAGILRYRHHVLLGRRLNRFQFHQLYTRHFGSSYGRFGGSERTVTRFECQTGFVRREGVTLKVAYCVRGYRKLAGLYDVVVKAVALGDDQAGVETSLALSGVGFENARRLTARYLGAIAWEE
jgi:hypothetical protein